MSDAARDRIFSRLKTALADTPADAPVIETGAMESIPLEKEEKIAGFKHLLEAMRSEVYVVQRSQWTAALQSVLEQKQVKTLLYAPQTDLGASIDTAFSKASAQLPELIAYGESIEAFKKDLFQIDAGITSTKGGIADTGAVILWPDEKEPRLMSLVPPVHIAVVHADQIYGTLDEVIHKQGWATGMPTNAILVSGPSKTADIEFSLVFGVHGPKELVVFILK